MSVVSPIWTPRVSEEADLAWCAGFFDGEGFVTIGRRNHVINGVRYTGHYLRVGINHVAKEPLLEMQRILGGNIEYKETVVGNRKPRHLWRISTSHAAACLVKMMPYLRNKIRVAELGLEFQRTMQDHKKSVPAAVVAYRESLKEQITALNAND